MKLLLMTIPLIRETKAKPKNNSLLDLYYPWIIDGFSLILLSPSEHIKNKSCVWSAEQPFLSSLPGLSKLDQRIGSSEVPPLLGPGSWNQEFLKWVACTWAPERSLYSLLWLPCRSSGDGKVWRVCSCVLLLSSKTFPFSPSFLPPTASWSLHVLKLLAPWHCPLRNREGYLGTKPSWLRFLSPSALRWPGVACSTLHGFCQTLVRPLEKCLANGVGHIRPLNFTSSEWG